MITVSRWRVILVVLAALYGILFTLPNVLPASVRDSLPAFLPKQTLNLGLDLQGGSYLLYEVDTAALRTEQLTNLVEDTRTTLREAEIDFTGLGVVNGEVNARINDPAKVEEAAKLLRQSVGTALAGVAGGRDVTVGIAPDQRIRVAYVAQALDAQAAKAVEQSIEVIRRRIDELGTKEPDIRRQGTNRISIAAPGES
ncbi:MAG TPA: protein translocase subunit SecD, partial [Phenylobacterium sp.]|nr:protein translocase subunit SecD [Phenylobacterium sp.]